MSKQAAATDEIMAKANCPECETTQNAQHKRCMECGEPMAKSVAMDEADYDDALKALGMLAKGNVPAGPSQDMSADDGDDETPAPRRKRAPAVEPDGDEDDMTMKSNLPEEYGFVEAEPLIDALLKANNRQAVKLNNLFAGISILAKSQHVHMLRTKQLFEENKQLREQLEGQRDRSPGRRSVSVLAKGNQLQGDGAGDEDTSLRGPELMAKANTAMLMKPGFFTSTEAAAIDDYVGRGASVAQIKQIDGALGAKLEGAIAGVSH